MEYTEEIDNSELVVIISNDGTLSINSGEESGAFVVGEFDKTKIQIFNFEAACQVIEDSGFQGKVVIKNITEVLKQGDKLGNKVFMLDR